MKPRSRPDAPEPPPQRIDLFAPRPDDDPEAADPVALSRTATLASGRAMAARLWPEARALAALAETYARLAQRAGRVWDDERNREPTEAEFAAVRRKVMGWDEEAARSRSGAEAGSDALDDGPQ